MSIQEYDEERHMRQTKEEGYEEGYESGLAEGEKIGRKSGLAEGEKIGRNLFKQTILLRRSGKSYEQIADQYHITVVVSERYVRRNRIAFDICRYSAFSAHRQRNSDAVLP